MKIRRDVLALAVAGALSQFASQTLAQQPRDQGSEELERIQVTGTRIKKAEVEGQVPVTVLSREELEKTGITSVGDILQRLTYSGSALNTRFNSSGNFGFPPDGGGVGAGSTQVNLRHLGSKRVLVLVDGLRWVNESSASGVGAAVDLNTIPLAAIDRIEILEDGASSIYGSDAIAGVVNIITRRDFDAAQATSYYGRFGEGDGETTNAEFSWGGSSERYSFFLSASFVEQKGVSSGDREQSRFPVPGTGVALGSSAIPAGRFIFIDPRTGQRMDLVPNAGVRNPRYNGQPGCNRTDDFHCFTADDRFNYAPFNLLVTPSKRNSLFGQARYQVSDGISWYFKGLYNKRESLNQAAPEPFFLGPLVAVNFWVDNVRIPANHPHNPFGIDLISGQNLLLIGRRPLEGGPRRFFQDVDTWYAATGFEGEFDFAGRSLLWDLSFVRSESRADQLNYGSYNARRVAVALGPVDRCRAEPGCVPLNIFGEGTITREMLAYIQPVLQDRSRNAITILAANLTGDLFDLPAGPLAFATGLEHRRLSGSYQPDGLTVAGEYNGVVSRPTWGRYEVDEFYLELNAPLYASDPQRLDLSLAGRYSDYSTFGGETTGKAGFRWQLAESLLLRATYAQGFRAPSIGELFGGAAGFDAVINDPCSGNVTPNCRALGVPAGYVQPNPQIGITTGGNPLLQPEQADSWSAGLVFSPELGDFARRLDFGLSYYRHKLKDAIGPVDAQTQLNLCVAQGPTSPFCQGIIRNPTGAIQEFNNRLQNLGRIETDGVDLAVNWDLPSFDFGEIGLGWRTTWVNDYKATDVLGAQQPQRVGVEVNDSAIPEWTSNLELSWRLDAWSAVYGLRHISDLEESCGNAASFPVCRDQANRRNRLGSTTYHDLQLSYDLDWLKGTRFTVGVNNLFDKEPPICLSCSLNGYDASTYDPPGSRFWYLRAQFRL